MHSVPELSKKTAEVAIRILNGEKAGDIKPSFVPLASPIFDWRQMQRWGISESSLPPGSTIAFESRPCGSGIRGRSHPSSRFF